MPLVLSSSAITALTAACRRAAPCEAAGFVLGARRGAVMHACEILALGAAGREGEFEIADHELRRARAWSEERALEIVALFHSHPGGSLALSAGDRASLRHSQWPWLIVAPGGGESAVRLAAYRPGDGRRLAGRDFSWKSRPVPRSLPPRPPKRCAAP